MTRFTAALQANDLKWTQHLSQLDNRIIGIQQGYEQTLHSTTEELNQTKQQLATTKTDVRTALDIVKTLEERL